MDKMYSQELQAYLGASYVINMVLQDCKFSQNCELK